MATGKVLVCAAALASLLSWNGVKTTVPEDKLQAVIENARRPLSADAGRVLVLKETLRIADEGKGFFFKEPWALDAAADGSILVQDGLKLYKFSPDGRFLGNLAKVGQGPGEFSTEITDILAQAEAVFLFSAPSSKLIKLDPDGKLLREWVLDKKRFFSFAGIFEDRFLMLDYRPDVGREEGPHQGFHTLFMMNEDKSFVPTKSDFTVRYSIQLRSHAGRTGSSFHRITRLRSSLVGESYVYAADGQEYLIKQVDLKKGEIARSFRREYPRVRYRKTDPRDSRQMPEFENDLHQLLVHGQSVWALTSTFDPAKGVLTDVFDEAGRFVDSFYLPLTAVRTGDTFYARYFPMVIRGDHLYTIEHDADWNFSIARYEIPDAGVR